MTIPGQPGQPGQQMAVGALPLPTFEAPPPPPPAPPAAAGREAAEATPTKELRPDDQQMIEDFRADIAEILQGRQRGRVYSWVAVWVLLKCHDQWRENCHRVAAQRNAAYSGLDTTGVDEQVLRDLVAENGQLRAELERYRGLDAAAKELLARNVAFGTRADNAEAKREDLEDEVERLRAWAGPTVKVEWGVQDATEPLDLWGAVASDSREDARRDAERYSREVLTNGEPTPSRVVTRLAGAWVEVPDA